MGEVYAKSRIVSLCPSITETLIDFGLAEQIVGVTKFCIHPADVVARLPKVGGTKDPDLDLILAARPDLVLLNEEENRREDFEALTAKGVPVETSLPKRVTDVPAELRRLGDLTGATEIAERRAVELEARIAALEADEKPGFTYAYLIWRDPWMSVNDDTYVADLLGRAGGINVFGDAPDRYPAVTLDDLRAKHPDVVFLPDEPFPFKAKHQAELAVEGLDRTRLVSGDDCCWHGVRSIRGVRLMRTLVSDRIESHVQT
jgi:iron complex transport system substrate-binding protein